MFLSIFSTVPQFPSLLHFPSFWVVFWEISAFLPLVRRVKNANSHFSVVHNFSAMAEECNAKVDNNYTIYNL